MPLTITHSLSPEALCRAFLPGPVHYGVVISRVAREQLWIINYERTQVPCSPVALRLGVVATVTSRSFFSETHNQTCSLFQKGLFTKTSVNRALPSVNQGYKARGRSASWWVYITEASGCWLGEQPSLIQGIRLLRFNIYPAKWK